jgi:hypothetical protein
MLIRLAIAAISLPSVMAAVSIVWNMQKEKRVEWVGFE